MLSCLSLLPDQTAGDCRCHVSADTKTVPSLSVSPVSSVVSTGAQTHKKTQTQKPPSLRFTGYNGPIVPSPDKTQHFTLQHIFYCRCPPGHRLEPCSACTCPSRLAGLSVSQTPAAVTERLLRTVFRAEPVYQCAFPWSTRRGEENTASETAETCPLSPPVRTPV